jgi:hypothetical protein
MNAGIWTEIMDTRDAPEARASSGDVSDEQLLELFRGNEQHLPPGVRRRLEVKGMGAVDQTRG